MTQEELDHLKILMVLHLITVDYLLQIFGMFLQNLEECLLQNIGECHLQTIKVLNTEEECQIQWVIVVITAEMYHKEEDLLLIIEEGHL